MRISTLASCLSLRDFAMAGMATVVLAVSSVAVGQQVPDEGTKDDTPEIVPQSESMAIEAYTGPPIFLPEPPTPPEATRVETKEVTEYYDPETKEHPRVTRTVVRFSDETMKNDGLYREHYADGQIFVEGEFRLGAPAGEWKYFHPDGKPAKTVTFEAGKPTGEIEILRADGTVKAKRNFADGKRTGDWTLFGDEGEQVIIESHYVDGKPDGVWQVWYPNGKQRRQIPFVDGKQQGTVIEWDKEGVKRAEASFDKGIRDGITRLWNADGKVYEQEYEDGKLISTKEIKP
jgi:antitoxin component YwqK of YwqJK toxin-antitoxin module